MISILFLLAFTTLPPDSIKATAHYDGAEAQQLEPLLLEILKFPTLENRKEAHLAQKQWLRATATKLGFTFADAGLVSEIELPGPPGAPVLGLIVHGDVTAVDASNWTHPPFEGASKDGFIWGRGAADDKGPLIQALLAMKAIKDSGIRRTHTIRLLVGSDEESSNLDMASYLKSHRPPDYSLVLDSMFPVVVGEKGWSALTLTAPLDCDPSAKPFGIVSLDAGLAVPIVPDRAELVLRANRSDFSWKTWTSRIRKKKLPPGITLKMEENGRDLRIIATGKAAHGGVNLEGGRNALFALAKVTLGELPPCSQTHLLAFSEMAGRDLHGVSLDLGKRDPLWGPYDVNVAMIKSDPAKKTATLSINIRRTPPLTGTQLKSFLEKKVSEFNQKNHSHLEAGGFFEDEPLVFDPSSPFVQRLLKDYREATNTQAAPAISGGGTYAKRFPNAIAFGMWFTDKPYPGHDVDEKVPVSDLHRGTKVLIHTLVDIATGPKIDKPFTARQ